jgi:hypothetical protein
MTHLLDDHEAIGYLAAVGHHGVLGEVAREALEQQLPILL